MLANRLICAGTLVLVVLASLLAGGCGSGASSNSTAADGANGAAAVGTARRPDTTGATTGDGSSANEKQRPADQNADRFGPRKAGQDEGKTGGDQPHPEGDSSAKSQGNSQAGSGAAKNQNVVVEGCGAEAHSNRCDSLQAASEAAQKTSKAQAQGQCSGSFSKSECAAALEAIETAAANSTTLKPGQCPASLSDSQCEAAMKASYEASQGGD